LSVRVRIVAADDTGGGCHRQLCTPALRVTRQRTGRSTSLGRGPAGTDGLVSLVSCPGSSQLDCLVYLVLGDPVDRAHHRGQASLICTEE
jgi:hypothetical protein